MNWTAVGPSVAAATGYDNSAKQLERDLEKAYGDRDALLPAIDKEIARARDLLLAQVTGARCHIAHISTRNAMAMMAHARRQGLA